MLVAQRVAPDEAINRISTPIITGLRPNLSASGQGTIYLMALPNKSEETEKITRLVVVPRSAAILGMEGIYISWPIGPSVASRPRIMVKKRRRG